MAAFGRKQSGGLFLPTWQRAKRGDSAKQRKNPLLCAILSRKSPVCAVFGFLFLKFHTTKKCKIMHYKVHKWLTPG